MSLTDENIVINGNVNSLSAENDVKIENEIISDVSATVENSVDINLSADSNTLETNIESDTDILEVEVSTEVSQLQANISTLQNDTSANLNGEVYSNLVINNPIAGEYNGTFNLNDWIPNGAVYYYTVLQNIHNLGNPIVQSVLVQKDSYKSNNLYTYRRLPNNSIQFISDVPFSGAYIIKGEQ